MFLINSISHLLVYFTDSIVAIISASGYYGLAALMALESAAIPIPSEVIMPFAGFLASQGKMSLWGAGLAGALGSTLGSFVIYYIAKRGGRPLLEKYGKYILISSKHLDSTDKFFQKYGVSANFIGRMLPIFRTYISIPAGLASVKLRSFLAMSFVGSFIWSYFLAWIGLTFGQQWIRVKDYTHYLSVVILIAIFFLVIRWFLKNLNNGKI